MSKQKIYTEEELKVMEKEAEKQENLASWWEGFYKCVLSITFAPYVTIGSTALTILSLGFSAVTKVAELALPDGFGQETFQKLSKQSRSLAANSFFNAISFSIPIIPFIEGCANMYTDRRNFGMADIGRQAAKGLSGGWFGGIGIPQTKLEEFKQQQTQKNIAQQTKYRSTIPPKQPEIHNEKSHARDRLKAERKDKTIGRARSKSV